MAEYQRLEMLVTGRTRDEVSEALWASLVTRVESAVDEILKEPEYEVIDPMRT